MNSKTGFNLLSSLRPPLAWWVRVVVGVTVAVTALNGWHTWQVVVRTRPMVARAPSPGVSAQAMSERRQALKELNALLEASGFSWTTFLDRLETVVPEKMSILTIQPTFGQPVQVTVTALATREEDLSAFFERLNASPWFLHPFIQRSSWTGAQGVIQFTMTFEYRG